MPYFLNGFGFYAGFYRFGQGQTREVSEDFLFRSRKSQPNSQPTASQMPLPPDMPGEMIASCKSVPSRASTT